MFWKRSLLVGICLLMLVGATGAAVQVQADEAALIDDPWLQKPVLSYLLLTQNKRYEREAQDLFMELNLSDEEETALMELARDEQQTLRTVYRQSQDVVLEGSSTKADIEEGVSRHNEEVFAVMANTDNALRKLLGDRYSVFRVWIREWWDRELKTIKKLKEPQEGNGTRSDAYMCTMFATQYHGYTNYEVALPDKYVKFANLGWYIPPPYDERYSNPDYTVNINRGDDWVLSVLVREVGPWNIDDNYWDEVNGTNPRRFLPDGPLPLCWSEAEYAYYYGYNNGQDYLGRTVTVPTSVDLTPAVAADLGLGYLENDWLDVYYYDLP